MLLPGIALLWAIKHRVVVSSHRHFGTSYRSHLQGSRKGQESLTLEDETFDP